MAKEVLDGEPMQIIYDAQGNVFTESAFAEQEWSQTYGDRFVKYTQDPSHSSIRVVKVVPTANEFIHNVADYVWALDDPYYQSCIVSRVYDGPEETSHSKAIRMERHLRFSDIFVAQGILEGMLKKVRGTEEHA